MADRLVAGEPTRLLIEALEQIDWKPRQDGMTRVTAVLEPRLGDPFIRALQRIELDLLRSDAAAVGLPDAQSRTPEQRAADALVALALRVAEAMEDK
jgi:hypothetical protein